MSDVEGLQFFVAVFHVGVARAGKIAAMDVRPPQRVTDASLRIIIGLQNFLLLVFGHFVVSLGGGIRQSAADSEQGLECLCRINKHRQFMLGRLRQVFKF